MVDKMFFYRMLRNFLTEYLTVRRNASVKTVRAYKQSLNQFRIYIRDKKGISFEKFDISCFSRDMVYSFLVYLRDIKNCSAATLNLRLAAIKAFLCYCGGEDISCSAVHLEVSSIRKFKGDKKPGVEYLQPEQLKLLYTVPDVNTSHGRRDLFIMIFLYETGARIDELVNLVLGDIKRNGKTAQLRIRGKGKKVRHIPILEDTLVHLDAYLNEFHPIQGKEKLLFYTVHDGMLSKMSPGTVDYLLKKHAKQTAVTDGSFPRNLHAHMFRHSIAMAMYKRGVPLSYIKDFLGHANFDTVAVYAYADGETITEALRKANHEQPAVPKVWESREKELLAFCGLE
jgi:site-specific recombinase XerD